MTALCAWRGPRIKGKAAGCCAETVNGGDSLWKALEKSGETEFRDPIFAIVTLGRPSVMRVSRTGSGVEPCANF
jgi:hypothetical protein